MAARNFSQLIRLVEAAEKKLIKAGQTDPLLRITTLRGIYYGAKWSKDYQTEKSGVRNWGFWAFTGCQDPPDPSPALGDKLFKALQASQDIIDRRYRIDLGHVLIGLDARKSSVSRSSSIPTMGGSGLELCTWLGDLGGGAANLAFRRIKNPKCSVASIFSQRGSDYGASINLEGDIGGYLVAAGTGTLPDEPAFSKGKGFADALKRYLPIGSSTSEWNTRAARFAIALGGTIQSGRLIYPADLSIKLRQKIQDWGAWYMSQRYILSGQLKKAQITEACRHLSRTAAEVAMTFVFALDYSIKKPKAPVAGRTPFPKPGSPRQDCSNTLLKTAVMSENMHDFFDELSKQSRSALKGFLDF